MNPEELHRLIDELLEQSISEADFLRLEAEMIVDPLARKAYLARVELSDSLRVLARESESMRPAMKPIKARWMMPVRSAWALAAMLAVFAGVAALVWQGSSHVEDSEAGATGFAVLSNQVDAVWDSKALKSGDLIPTGMVKLGGGMAQVEVFSGVTLVMEGAAEFELLSPMEMRLAAGKLRALVPEAAHGFRVRTADGDVVDLGTEFALNVSGKQSEVHVLNGSVEWHPQGQNMRLMNKGDAVRAKLGTAGEPIPADEAVFAGVTALREHEAASMRERQASWQRRLEELKSDPRLLALYALATPGGTRHVENLAAGENRSGAGAVVAAAVQEDRWGRAEGALDFSPTGSRVRLHAPGTHGSLTMLCWVKINSLDRLYNSLFLTDGHEIGAPHWQLTRDGRLFFSVKKREVKKNAKHDFFSQPFWSPALAGQWLMLGVVYDVNARQVTHYLNGEPIGQEAIPEDYLVTEVHIGNASIGNWSQPVYRTDAQFVVRNLNGSMDEFAMFGAALSAEEIAGFYAQGRP